MSGVKKLTEICPDSNQLKINKTVPMFNSSVNFKDTTEVDHNVQSFFDALFLIFYNIIVRLILKWAYNLFPKTSFSICLQKNLDSEEVFLNGPFYLGGLDYLENKNSYPTSVWSTSLQVIYLCIVVISVCLFV